METKAKETKPRVKLIGRNGNAFAILATCRMAARKANWTTEKWKEVEEEMISGDYDHLLRTAVAHFEVY